jgi:multiple sugar transport system ATP-binding protein
MRIEIAKLHNRLETTMIYVTHDQVEAMTMADKIVVLRAGHIEQVGSPLELYTVAAQPVRGRVHRLAEDELPGRPGSGKAWCPHHRYPPGTYFGFGKWRALVRRGRRFGASGSDTFFHVHNTGLAETVTVRADGEVGFRHGDRIHLTPRDDIIHRFDARV